MFIDMKKYFIMLAAALTAVACSQNELQDPNGNQVEIPQNGFYAGIATKVTLESDYSLSWEKGDQVAVWNGEELLAPYVAETAGKSTMLVGEDVDTQKAHYAFYPYDAVQEFDGTTVTAVIPGQQTPKVGTFPFNPSVAYAPAGEQAFLFYNICGLVGFEITEAEQGVTNVVIFGNNNENLTGTVEVSYDEVSAPQATVIKGVKSVTLQAESTFEPGTYYVAVLPQQYLNGITITMNTPEGKQYKKDSKPFTLRRSHRINAMNINDGEFAEENTISNAAELQAFFNIVNADENKGAGMTGKIVADIDLSHLENFTPAAEFAGTLDGSYTVGEETRNHSITNTSAALIGTLTEAGVVKNITVSGNISINADDDAAFVVLNNAGKISYCKAAGQAQTLPDLAFTKERAVGAIAARTSGTIEYCTNEAAITLRPLSVVAPANQKRDGAQYVGGIAGFATAGTITGCTNTATGSVTYTTPDNGAIFSYACLGGILGTSESVLGVSGLQNRVSIADSDNAAKITYESKAEFSGDKNNGLAIGGVVGYLEGAVSRCGNSGEIYVRGYRHESEDAITSRVRPLAAAGVAGVASESITDCTNSGKVDVDIAIAGASNANQYFIGYNETQVAGVVAKSLKKASGCHNTGALKADIHMLKSNGSAGSVGGVIGWASGTVSDCSNKARLEVTPRMGDNNVAGVLAKTTATYDNLSNIADESVNAGVFVTIESSSTENQGKTINVGGVVGWTGANQTVTKMSNSAPVSFVANDGVTSGTRIMGGLIAGMGGSAKVQFKGASSSYIINSGSITFEGEDIDYVGGVIGRVQNSANNSDALASIYVKNTGNITVNHSGTNEVVAGGIVGTSANDNTKGQWWIRSSANEGAINVTSGGNVKVGGVEGRNGDVGSRLVGCQNKGNITVNSTGSDVRVGGLRGDGNGQINTSSLNTGDIAVTTSASSIQLGGLTGNDGTTVVAASAYDCNMTLNYTGTDSPKVYASLAVAYRQGANASYKGTYGGTINLLDKDGNKLTAGTIYCGLLEGYTTANLELTLTDVSLKKGTSINGVEISEENYNSDAYLFPNLNGTTVTHTKVTLVD